MTDVNTNALTLGLIPIAILALLLVVGYFTYKSIKLK